MSHHNIACLRKNCLFKGVKTLVKVVFTVQNHGSGFISALKKILIQNNGIYNFLFYSIANKPFYNKLPKCSVADPDPNSLS